MVIPAYRASIWYKETEISVSGKTLNELALELPNMKFKFQVNLENTVSYLLKLANKQPEFVVVFITDNVGNITTASQVTKKVDINMIIDDIAEFDEEGTVFLIGYVE